MADKPKFNPNAEFEVVAEKPKFDPNSSFEPVVEEEVTETVTETPAESSIPTVTMDANDGLVPEGSGEFDIKNPTKATGVINIPKGGVTSVALQVEQDKYNRSPEVVAENQKTVNLQDSKRKIIEDNKTKIRNLGLSTSFAAANQDPMEGQQQQQIEGGLPGNAVEAAPTDFETGLNEILNPKELSSTALLDDNDRKELLEYADKINKYAPAIQQLGKQLEQAPDDVKTLNDLADNLSAIDDKQTALSLYSKANAIKENGQSLMGLGNVYLQAGQDEEAIKAFSEAFDKDGNPDALIKAAYTGSRMDNFEGSDKILKEVKKEFPNYSYSYALSAYNKEASGDVSGAKVDNAIYENLRQMELLPESVNADDPNSDYAKERASQQARMGNVAAAIATPINFFGEMEMGAIEGGIEGLKKIGQGAYDLAMPNSAIVGNKSDDKIGAILNIANGAAETVFSGAMAMTPVVNAGFHMLPESVNKVLMQPLNVIGDLSDEELASYSKNTQGMFALGNTLASILLLGAVHKGPKKFTAKENEAILNIVKGEAIEGEGLSLKGIVNKAKKVLEESKLTDFQDAEKVWTSIPKELSTQDKLVVAPDLIKRERLQEEMAKASPAFKNYFKEKIDKVDEDINAKLSINLGLKEQAAEKTKSAEAPPKTITNETVKTSKVEEGSGSKQAEVIRKDEVGQEVLIPEYSEKLKDVSPETKVVDLPDGISVEFNGEKGTIGRSETGETLFINAEGKETIVGGGGDVATLAEKGISRTEGTYSDKRGDYYVKDNKVYEVTKDGLKPVYEGEKANVERKEAIIRKALNPEKPKEKVVSLTDEVKVEEPVVKEEVKPTENVMEEPITYKGVKYSDIIVGDKRLEDILSEKKLTEPEKKQVREVFSRHIDYFKFDKEGQERFQQKFSNPEDITDVADIITGIGASKEAAFDFYNQKNYENVKDALNYIIENPDDYSSKVVDAIKEIKKGLENSSSSMNKLYAIDILKELGLSNKEERSKNSPAEKKEPTLENAISGVMGNQGLSIMEADFSSKGEVVIKNIGKASKEQIKKIESDFEKLKKLHPDKNIELIKKDDSIVIRESGPAKQKVADTPSSRPIEKFESGVAFEEAGSGHNVLFTDKDGKKSVVGKVFGTEGKTGAEFDSWVKPQIEAIHYKEVVKAVERGDAVPKEVLDHYLSSKIEGDYDGMLAEAIKSVKENGPKKEIFSEQEIGEVMDKRAEELSQMKRTKDYVFQLIHDNFGGITEAQWNRFGDANWLKGKEGKKFRKKYIKNDAGKTDTNDFGSFSLSSGEGSSIEITPQNVVDYIMDRETNPKKYDGRLKQWNDAASIPKKDVPSLLSGDDAMVLSIAESNRGLGMTDLEVDTIKRYVESKAKNEARAKNTKPRSAESAPKSEGSAAKSERVGRKPGEKAQKKKDEAKSVKAEESKYVEAEKKISKIFDTLRAKLIADLPEGTKKSGVGAKEVLDAAEKIVKAALKAGEAIETAIQKGKDYINENWKKEFGDISELINEGNFNETPLNKRQLGFAKSGEFKKWFGDWEKKGESSKIVDKDGNPLVVYHGSPEIFSEFDSNKLGEYTGADSAKEGFFFTDNVEVADSYRKADVVDSPNLKELNNALEQLSEKALLKMVSNVFKESERQYHGLTKSELIEEIYHKIDRDSEGYYPDRNLYIEKASKFLKKNGVGFEAYENIGSTNSLFLNVRNPFVFDAKGQDAQSILLTEKLQEAKKKGHDGAIIKNVYDSVSFEEKGNDTQKSTVYIAFKPEQVKNINNLEPVFKPEGLSKYFGAEKMVVSAFEKLREKLIAKLPEGTQKMGVGLEDLLNAAEKVIIGAIRAGEKIDVAISKGLDHLKEKWDDSFGEFPEKELRDILKENGEIQLSHEKTDALREKYGMEEREINDPVSTEKTRAEAQKIIKKGFDVIKLANEVIKKERTITPVERAILAERVAILDKELLEGDTTSPEYAKKMEEQNKLIKASEISASQAGSSLGSIAHIKVVADESLAGYFQEQRRVNKEGALTEKQTATNKKEFEEITKVKEAYEKRLAKIQEENNRLKAEKEVEKLTKKASKRTAKEKLDEDFDLLAKEFSSIAKNTLNAGINPELIPVVLKMVKNRVEKGVITLSEVVDAVHDKVGEFGISKEDIIAAIAGKSGVERTRSEVAKNGYELKQEARLVQKLMDLQNGKEPSSERGKIQKNARLEELRKQIKEHDLTKTAEYKKRLDAQIAEVERELATGDFAKEEKAEPLKLDKETLELQDKYMQMKNERDARLLKEEYDQRSDFQKATDIGMSLINAPMTMMSGGEFSAVLRQGLVASIAHPKLAIKAATRMFKFFKSQKDFDRWNFEVKKDPRYLAAKESGLAIVDPHDPKLSAREEAFMGNIVEKIPIYGGAIRLVKIKDGKLVRTEGEYGGMVKASERAYVGFLNKMRWDVYNLLSERLKGQGITPENNPGAYKDLASYVNNSTGRGNVGKGIERLSPALNATFFSPRLWASRLKLLSNWANPWWYKNVPKEVRRFYWEDFGKLIGTMTVVYSLAKLNGASVETDPRSSDFLKIRDGKKRYDNLGGFQQPIRTLAQYASGQKKDIESGEITELTDPDKSLPNRLLEEKRLAVIWQHIRGKFSPVPAAVADFSTGRMMDYSEPTVEKEIMRMIVPLAWQDIYDAYGQEGASSLVTSGIPTVFGVSTSIYKDRPKEEAGEKPDKPDKPKKKKRNRSGFN